MRDFISIAGLLLTGLVSNGQSVSELKFMIRSADTILLVSHKQTDGFIIVDEKTGNKSEPQKVVINGRPNLGVITKSVILPDTSRQMLIRLITRQNTDRVIETCCCFVPFHSALLIKDGKTAFVDIMFGCNTFIIATNKSSTLPIYLGKDNMKELEMFFKINGILVD